MAVVSVAEAEGLEVEVLEGLEAEVVSVAAVHQGAFREWRTR